MEPTGSGTVEGPDRGAGAARRRLARLLGPRGLAGGERRVVIEQLFFEGPERGAYLLRFSALMILSVAIGSFGLLADSAAVVIGAMLVAPLMTPILASSAATVMVWPKRQLLSLLHVVLAAAGAIALAALISQLMAGRDPLLSGEVLARTRPTTLDLGVALAAGAAAAYVTVRTKAGGALPGVAIAVALVPPLATTGILLPRGEYDLAGQALLLFATNLFAILLAAMVVFLLAGLLPTSRSRLRSRQIHVGLLTTIVLVGAVAYPLWQQGRSLVANLRDTQLIQSRVTDAFDRSDSDVVVLDTQIDSDADPVLVTLTLAGPADSEPAEDELARAADNMAADLETKVTLRIHYTTALIEDGDPSEGTGGIPPPSGS